MGGGESLGLDFWVFFVFAVLFVGAFGCEIYSPCDAPDNTAEDTVETWVAVVHNYAFKAQVTPILES